MNDWSSPQWPELNSWSKTGYFIVVWIFVMSTNFAAGVFGVDTMPGRGRQQRAPLCHCALAGGVSEHDGQSSCFPAAIPLPASATGGSLQVHKTSLLRCWRSSGAVGNLGIIYGCSEDHNWGQPNPWH